MIGEREIGGCRFSDGICRSVFVDEAGRQFVWNDGEKVYGYWIHPDQVPDRAVIVQSGYRDGTGD